jgi:putative redox protein
MALKAHVGWAGDRTFLGRSGSSHSVIMDVDEDSGGHDAGVRPLEMLLLGMGGCTAYDVVHILQKGREPVEGCDVELEAERAEEEPRVFTQIQVKYVISGRGLDPNKVKRAVELSASKYCSATIMLGKTADISHEIEIVDLGEGGA